MPFAIPVRATRPTGALENLAQFAVYSAYTFDLPFTRITRAIGTFRGLRTVNQLYYTPKGTTTSIIFGSGLARGAC